MNLAQCDFKHECSDGSEGPCSKSLGHHGRHQCRNCLRPFGPGAEASSGVLDIQMNLLGAHRAREAKPKSLQDLTIKQILEKTYGAQPTAEILSGIQAAFNSGARGVELKARVDSIVAKYNVTTRDDIDTAVNVGATAAAVGAFVLAL